MPTRPLLFPFVPALSLWAACHCALGANEACHKAFTLRELRVTVEPQLPDAPPDRDGGP